MKLSITKREGLQKGEAKRIRREGNIPAIIYSQGKEGEKFAVNGSDYSAALRETKPGHLSCVVFTLSDEQGNERKAIVKDIQYHPTTYQVLHLDFVEIHAGSPIELLIPIELRGRADCAGVRAGGILRQIVRSMKVRCLPKDIPSAFELNIAHLNMKQSSRLKEITLPEGVTPRVNLETVAAVVAKR